MKEMTQDIEKRIDNLLDETQKLIKAEEEKRRKYYEAMGMSESEFHEMMETQDEILDIDTSIEKEYYILSEEEAT
ncbi:MAG: hypothetical protein GX287_02570, partial [Fusobacteria bacterium]|nr:hypothetical protein [Fusobacteriota bacterium]